MNAALALTAGRQGGVFSRKDAVAAGFSPGEIRHRLTTGEWAGLRRGSYADSTALSGRTSRSRHVLDIAAALRSLGVPAVASAWSAARVYGVETLESMPEGVWLACWRSRSHGSRRMSGVTLQPAAVWPDHLATAQGVSLTSARTGVDLARRMAFRPAVVLRDSVLRQPVAR